MAAGFKKLTDKQWEMVKDAMEWKPPLERGKQRTDLRIIWNAILYILSRGCRWADLPENREVYASRATAHRWLSIWKYQGVFDRVLSALLQVAMSKKLVNLTQISVDGSFSPGTWRRR